MTNIQRLGIRDAALHFGLSAHTLRYYERIGLLDAVARVQGGRRRYEAGDLAWIDFLLRLKITRMPIGKMIAFAKLRRAGDGTVAERRQMLESHLAELEAELRSIEQAAEQLRLKVAHYRSIELGASEAPSSYSIAQG